ncbi:MAG: hypothetical protein ACI4HI_06215 [Lachnospiraceae bacterium]
MNRDTLFIEIVGASAISRMQETVEEFEGYCEYFVKEFQRKKEKMNRITDRRERARRWKNLREEGRTFIQYNKKQIRGCPNIFQSVLLEEVLKEISEIMFVYIDTRRNKFKSKSTTPILIRKVCFKVCSIMYETIGKMQIMIEGEFKLQRVGVQAYVMRSLHNKMTERGVPYFVRENVLFTKDKWGVSPKKYMEIRLEWWKQNEIQKK